MRINTIDHNPVITNVTYVWEHIDVGPICSHEVGTLPNKWILYSRGNKQFYSKNPNKFQYNSHIFKLDSNWFLSDIVNIELPQRTNISTLERLTLSLGIPIRQQDGLEIDILQYPINTIFHKLTMLALKDMSIISNNLKYQKQNKYGEVVFGSYLESVRGSGRIRATNKPIRWLNEQDTLQLKSKLFKLSDSKKYKVGSYSMKYVPTPLAQDIMNRMFDLLKAVDFVHNEIELEPLDFVVPMELLGEIKLRDVMLLLGNCIGYDCGFIIRPQTMDYQFSRVYSVFTSISSDTRKQLGFYNHDIGSALQTICLQLVEDSSLYPLHQELADDKIAFRTKVMNEVEQDIDWVKTELSKIDNLDNMPKRYDVCPNLKAYYKEAQILRKEIINTAEPELLRNAQYFAKNKFDKFWIEGQSEYEFKINLNEYKESSLFFFVWTQWERQIRESMMSCFDVPEACHQVHDAVYSTQKVDMKVIEAKVLEDTGFTVNISE